MTIKHLVISGGGPTIFKSVGAIQELELSGFWNTNDIESIYGTSAGAIVGILICLRFDWETINDYLIKRPWHEACPINIASILDSYSKRGIFDEKLFEIIFKPLFNAKDLSLDITLKEFHEYSKIDLHMYSFELNSFEIEDISYSTHPDLKLLTAIQMTSALPIIIAPVFIGDKCYIDGGFVSNYPLSYCIQKYGNDSIDEILGFRNDYEKLDTYFITDKSNISDYMMTLLHKLVCSLSTEPTQSKIPNEIAYKTSSLSVSVLQNTLSDINVRREMFEIGTKTAKDFLESKQQCLKTASM